MPSLRLSNSSHPRVNVRAFGLNASVSPPSPIPRFGDVHPRSPDIPLLSNFPPFLLRVVLEIREWPMQESTTHSLPCFPTSPHLKSAFAFAYVSASSPTAIKTRHPQANDKVIHTPSERIANAHAPLIFVSVSNVSIWACFNQAHRQTPAAQSTNGYAATQREEEQAADTPSPSPHLPFRHRRRVTLDPDIPARQFHPLRRIRLAAALIQTPGTPRQLESNGTNAPRRVSSIPLPAATSVFPSETKPSKTEWPTLRLPMQLRFVDLLYFLKPNRNASALKQANPIPQSRVWIPRRPLPTPPSTSSSAKLRLTTLPPTTPPRRFAPNRVKPNTAVSSIHAALLSLPPTTNSGSTSSSTISGAQDEVH
ncbi:hypothetical protein R3P38DRAFT_3380431 [Favolaschia claudopus]|uniref:Uncharacterized protein n=1 Tax=Favolaschia claudopus TaxID=2862362 RepID=A0AAV9Z2E3_9AGAR